MDYIKVYKDISSRTMTKQNAMQRLSLTDKRFFSDHQNKPANTIYTHIFLKSSSYNPDH